MNSERITPGRRNAQMRKNIGLIMLTSNVRMELEA